jgi:hypothetical protein
VIVGWARAWHSRAVRLQGLAARYRDIAVLTDRRLMLYEVGWFTRRPRRRVLADRLDELTVEDVSRSGNAGKLRFSKAGHRAMLLEFGQGAELGQALLTAAGRRIATPELEPERTSESPGDEEDG